MIDWAELLQVALRSGWQAILSAGLALMLGGLGALGLCAIPVSRRLAMTEIFVLLPAWLPPIFVLLSILTVSSLFGGFPYGLMGVVIVHAVSMAGLAAVTLSRVLRQRLGHQVELAWIEGASRWRFLREVAWPQLRGEIALLALVFFGFSFTSFSIPLVVGGVQASTFEILIYQKFRSGAGLSSVVLLSLIEWSLLLFVAQMVREIPVQRKRDEVNLSWLAFPSLLVLPLLMSAVVLVGGSWTWKAGYDQFQQFAEIKEVLPHLISNSFFVAVGTGIFLAACVAGLGFFFPNPTLRKFLISVSSPTTVLVGAVLIVVLPMSGFVLWLKLILGFGVLFLPSLVRLLGLPALEALNHQLEVARICGASRWLIWTRIVLPQMSQELGLIAALGSLWAVGEFALSRLLLPQDQTLALLVQEMMSSYRMDLASWLMFPLIGLGLVTSILFWGAGYVAHRKFAA